ncbi:PREDICTED: uncharacterized protein LOC103798075, partial [Acanthisitta chloris]|uniref:uncharacterized protein LOC103798075 n=1 Tax=Acanthisitta chloris TaxID=57068 RepID=UPI0004F0D19B
MRTRKSPCPMDKTWGDKHGYSGADGDSTTALEVINGVCHENSMDGDLKKPRNGKKQRKRKRSPKSKPNFSKLDSLLLGMSTDGVWLDKPLYDHAEMEYRKKLMDSWNQEVAEIGLLAQHSPVKSKSKEIPKARMVSSSQHCSHGFLAACHHVIQGVWLNKLDFDKAEEIFVEKSQFFLPPNVLVIPSGRVGNVGLGTPDEGYVTALPTPATPSFAPGIIPTSSSSSIPNLDQQTVNGKPQISNWETLTSEVWLEKPLYDGAEKNFYQKMLEKNQELEIWKIHQEDRKSHPVGKQKVGKNMEIPKPFPSASKQLPSYFFLHEDSESVWLDKSLYDAAESRFYAAKTWEMGSGKNPELQESTVGIPSQPWNIPTAERKKMAVDYFLHDKVWLDKYKYDDAERRFYEQMNGPVGSSSRSQ